MRFFTVRVCVALLILTGGYGCAKQPPIQAWYTTTQPVTETATLIEADGVYCQMINIFYPGSEPPSGFFGPQQRTFLLLPGRTRLQVAYFWVDSTGKAWNGVAKVVEFEAKAGHTYTFNSYLPLIRLDWFRTYEDKDWDVQVLDREAEQVVVETKARG